MYSPKETVGLELKYTAKDQLRAGLASARGTLTKFASFARGIGDKVAAGFKRMWAAVTGPVGMLVGVAGIGGIGAIGYGIKSYLTGAVQIAGEWEGYLAKLTVALKSATKAKEMFEWAKQFAATTPFEMGEVVDATTRLELYGLTAKKWLPLVGDMAGAMGRSITDAVEAVADAISGGGLERLKEFGITSNVLLKYGAKPGAAGGISYMGEDAIERLKKAIIAVMSERYGGGMMKLLATWMGKTSNLADAWSQIKGRIGEGMMPVLKKIVDKTTEWLNLLLKGRVGEKLGEKLGKGLQWAWDKAEGFVNYLIENWPTIKKKMEETWESVKAKIKEVVDKAKEWLGTTKGTTGKLDKANTSLGLMATSARSIANSLRSWSDSLKNVETSAAKVNQFWQMSRALAWGIATALAFQYEMSMNILRWTSPLGLSKKFREAAESATEMRKKAQEQTNQAYTDFLAATEDVFYKTHKPSGQAGGGGGAALKAATAPGWFRTPTGRLGNEAYGPATFYGPGTQAPENAIPVVIVNPQDIHRAGKGADRARQSSAGAGFGP